MTTDAAGCPADPSTIQVGDALPRLVRRPTTVQLFRFSAATWNAHRIHYDLAYAKEEGYPDVLVQSHLHACFLAQLVQEWAGSRGVLTRFRFENRAFAIPGDTLTCEGTVSAVQADNGRLVVVCELTERRGDGVVCTPAWATVEFPLDGTAR